MSYFKFEKIKDKYIWINNQIKFVLSNGSYQAFDDYGFVKSEKNFMYLYYFVEIYAKQMNYEDSVGKEDWSLISSRAVYDFPGLIQLKNMLNLFLNTELPLSDYREFYYYNRIGDRHLKGYEFCIRTDGFLNEDVYELIQTIRVDDADNEIKKFYSLYIGCATDIQGGKTSIGVHVTDLIDEDLKELYKMIEIFFKDMINKQNERVKTLHKEYINSIYVNDNRLYRKNNQDEILEIITEGMCVDVFVLNGDLDSEDFSSFEYSQAKVKSITNTHIHLVEGVLQKQHKKFDFVEVPINKIIYICNDLEVLESEKLNWNEFQITEHFLSVLSDIEKQEFRDKDIPFLYNKWKECIIERYWMCRTEHDFPIYVKEMGNHENVYYIV